MIRRTVVTCLVLIAAAFVVAPAHADLGGFTIKDFDVQIAIEENAMVEVRERIVVDFTEPRRGIYRVIPVRYTDPSGFRYSLGFRLLDVTDDQGREHAIKVSNEGQNKRIRIGDADIQHTGTVVYNLRYRLNNALRHFETHDELYWNVTGNQWATRIENVSATVKLPAAVPDGEMRRIAFTGAYGSTDADVDWLTLGGDRYRVEASRVLEPHEGLSFALGWPHGLVRFPGLIQRSARFLWQNVILLVPIVAFFGLLRRWRRIGRDPEGPSSVMVRYEPPKDLRPGEVGTLVDERVDQRDLTATIIDLAVRGHLRIEVEETKRLFGLISNDEVVFHRLAFERGDELLDYERLILNGIFFDGRERVEANELAQRFYTTIPKVKKSLIERLVKQGYFKGNPTKIMTRYIFAGIGAGFLTATLGLVLSAATGAVMPFAMMVPMFAAMITAVIFFVFAPAMPARTRRGVEARAWAVGFEEFVERVESDKLEHDQRRNVFEALLPYAMALGVADRWAQEFEGIYATGDQPTWYTGSSPIHNGITTAAFHRSLMGSMTQATQQMTAAPRSSSSSGFSGGGGGGFSGGGGGGGGGGSW